MKENYEMELHIATDNERIQKRALMSMENRLAQTENRLKTTENKLEECVNNLSNKNVVNLLGTPSFLKYCITTFAKRNLHYNTIKTE